ncbi:MAG: sulfotransferase domain-containing protein [bacterium]|nr:sulfotransferase domain-containing protein [bacterium]
MATGPNFLIAGASKAGSTWLRICLEDHPEVFMPSGPTLDFFSRNYDKGMAWYASHFKDTGGRQTVGEKSTSYIIFDDVPERIRAWNPDVRLIFILREPIARAYSHYCMNYRGGAISGDVDAELHADSRLVREGFYHHNIGRFLALFPREQVHILLYDDLRADAEKFYANVCTILGVDPTYKPEMLHGKAHVKKGKLRFHGLLNPVIRGMQWAGGHNRLAYRLNRRILENKFLSTTRLLNREPKYPVWSPEAKRRIAELYRSDVAKLSEMLGRDLSHWLAPYLEPNARQRLAARPGDRSGLNDSSRTGDTG